VVVQTQHLPYLVSHPLKRRAYHQSIEEVDRLIAISEGLRRTYARIGVVARKVHHDCQRHSPAAAPHGAGRRPAALDLEPAQPVVLPVGWLTHMKGQWHLIDAVPGLVARFPALAVVLLGDGPLRDSLAKRAVALGVTDAVRFRGHRPDARLLLAAAHALPFSSLSR
jgi:glycosyltransferase involved in cell wall biosynthesis